MKMRQFQCVNTTSAHTSPDAEMVLDGLSPSEIRYLRRFMSNEMKQLQFLRNDLEARIEVGVAGTYRVGCRVCLPVREKGLTLTRGIVCERPQGKCSPPFKKIRVLRTHDHKHTLMQTHAQGGTERGPRVE